MARHALTLLPLGIVIGFVGSVTGVGGGFLVVPLLLMLGSAVLQRSFTPEEVTGTSLAIVLINALSGTSLAARKGRIDYRTGLLFALATIPGAFAGRLLIRRVQPGTFVIVFAVLLVLVAVYLALGPTSTGRPFLRGMPREITESTGERHSYEIHRGWGLLVSFCVGFVSSMMGVGGGIIHSPFFILVCGAPTHIATATSQFILSFTSVVGAAEAAARGKVDYRVVLWMGIGVMLGGQLGVLWAKRIPARVVRWILGAVLVGAAVSLVARWAA